MHNDWTILIVESSENIAGHAVKRHRNGCLSHPRLSSAFQLGTQFPTENWSPGAIFEIWRRSSFVLNLCILLNLYIFQDICEEWEVSITVCMSITSYLLECLVYCELSALSQLDPQQLQL